MGACPLIVTNARAITNDDDERERAAKRQKRNADLFTNAKNELEKLENEHPPPYRDGSIVRERFTHSQVKSECIRHWDMARREGSEMLRVETRMKQYLQSVKEAQASITPRRGRKRKTPR